MMGRTLVRRMFSPALAALTSSAEASPCLVLPLRRGNRISFLRYSWRRSTLALRDSSERFWRRGSTEIPMVRANLRGMPAAFSSTSEKPRPGLTRRLSVPCQHMRCVHCLLSHTLDGRASHNGAEEVDGARSNLRGLGNTSVASGLLLARLYRALTSIDTGATALSGVRGDLPGRSARGRSVA